MILLHGFMIVVILMLSGCDTAAAPSEPPASAAVLINGSENQFVSSAAFMAAERVEALYLAGELRDLNLASAIVTRYVEIGAPWEAAITPAQALTHLNWIIAQVTGANANAMTACARAELLRQANQVRSVLNRATAGNNPPTQNDLTPFPQGSWPWGGCPFPAAVQNLTVSRSGSQVTVAWTHAQPETEFVVAEIRPTGAVVVARLDTNDCGNGIEGCTTGPRSLTFTTSSSAVLVQVDACRGLNCSSARGSAGILAPQPVNDLSFSRHGHTVTVQWAAVAGAEYYEVIENGSTVPARVTQPVYVDTKAKKDDKVYTYQVKACNTAGCSSPYTESWRK